MGKLGIIAGGGNAPLELITHLQAQKKPYHIIALHDITDNQPNEMTSWHSIGMVEDIITKLHEQQCDEITLLGKMRRPSFSEMKLDRLGRELVLRITKNKLLGDDNVLQTVIKFLEEHHLKVIGLHDIFRTILTNQGILTKTTPSEQDQRDITLGFEIAQTIGALDIGQAVIIEHGYVLGVEAAEGTDELIRRCKHLKREQHAGVLIKCSKPSQDKRVDLPAIGPDTIQAVYDGGFNGIALEAENSIIIDQPKTVALADRLGVFVMVVGSTY